MPLVIGVTGSIATGKSYLCKYLVERYAAVHADVDTLVHRMYDPGAEAFARIVEAFGPEVVGRDGYIDRRILGGMVFGSPEQALVLRNAIGDYASEVKKLVDHWRAELPVGQLAVLGAFNLVEGHYNEWCDTNWLLRAEDAIVLERIRARNGLSEGEAHARLSSARPWQVRAHACDRIIDNNGDVKEFESAIDAALAETLQWRDTADLQEDSGRYRSSGL